MERLNMTSSNNKKSNLSTISFENLSEFEASQIQGGFGIVRDAFKEILRIASDSSQGGSSGGTSTSSSDTNIDINIQCTCPPAPSRA